MVEPETRPSVDPKKSTPSPPLPLTMSPKPAVEPPMLTLAEFTTAIP